MRVTAVPSVTIQRPTSYTSPEEESICSLPASTDAVEDHCSLESLYSQLRKIALQKKSSWMSMWQRLQIFLPLWMRAVTAVVAQRWSATHGQFQKTFD